MIQKSQATQMFICYNESEDWTKFALFSQMIPFHSQFSNPAQNRIQHFQQFHNDNLPHFNQIGLF